MTRVKDICEIIEGFAPLALQEEYDNSGLQVGDEEMEVKGVLLSIDVTEEVVEEAMRKGCNMIVAHHPLLFHPLGRVCDQSDVEICVRMAIKNDIAIYATHTNIDNVSGGVSWRMAKKLGLENVRVLAPAADGINGSGVVGDLAVAMKKEEFLARLKEVFKSPVIRCTKGKKEIARVALCGGSGAEFIEDAIKAKADAYVTADLKYHDFFIQPSDMLLADIGHFESEQFTKEIFFEEISKKIPNFAVRESEVKTNQINYV